MHSNFLRCSSPRRCSRPERSALLDTAAERSPGRNGSPDPYNRAATRRKLNSVSHVAELELPAVLTVRETCEALRISRATLWRMIGRGDLSVIRLGRPGAALRVPAAEVERILNPTRKDTP
jgi:excisionase family DNA binding protein